MRYVDTSVLVAYMMPEIDTAAAEKFMLSAGEALAISSWSEVELLSALGVKIRSKQLSKAAALDVYTLDRGMASVGFVCPYRARGHEFCGMLFGI